MVSPAFLPNGMKRYGCWIPDPAVLRLIQQVIETAHRYGKLVGLCGELAGEPLAIPLLLGLGLDEFSMNPVAIPYARWLIRSVSLAALVRLPGKPCGAPPRPRSPSV
ncbi:MAG: hypothetical protein D6793_02650 [Thermoflexia bacterium]|nr:MAG: hypothetical protein D6793_02650 [Thermoflexia bacterium]